MFGYSSPLLKVYEHSNKATWSYGLWSTSGYLLFAFSLILTPVIGQWWLFIPGTLGWIVLTRIANIRAEKIAARDYEKLVEKDGIKREGILESTEQEQFRIPATIIITRINSFIGVLVPFKYILNGKYIVAVKNNQSVSVQTTSAINEISLVGTYGKLNDRNLMRFSVREGETLELVYKAQEFQNHYRR